MDKNKSQSLQQQAEYLTTELIFNGFLTGIRALSDAVMTGDMKGAKALIEMAYKQRPGDGQAVADAPRQPNTADGKTRPDTD